MLAELYPSRNNFAIPRRPLEQQSPRLTQKFQLCKFQEEVMTNLSANAVVTKAGIRGVQNLLWMAPTQLFQTSAKVKASQAARNPKQAMGSQIFQDQRAAPLNLPRKDFLKAKRRPSLQNPRQKTSFQGTRKHAGVAQIPNRKNLEQTAMALLGRSQTQKWMQPLLWSFATARKNPSVLSTRQARRLQSYQARAAAMMLLNVDSPVLKWKSRGEQRKANSKQSQGKLWNAMTEQILAVQNLKAALQSPSDRVTATSVGSLSSYSQKEKELNLSATLLELEARNPNIQSLSQV